MGQIYSQTWVLSMGILMCDMDALVEEDKGEQ